MNVLCKPARFTREPDHRRVALRCAGSLLPLLSLFSCWPEEPLPPSMSGLIWTLTTLLALGLWVVGFFFSVGSVLAWERQPLRSTLLVLFYLSAAALALLPAVRPLHSGEDLAHVMRSGVR